MRQHTAAAGILLLLFLFSLLCAAALAAPAAVGFGIMIDAGSTATRVHVYRWTAAAGGGALPNFTHDHFMEVSPGLSSFGQKPLLAGKSIVPLLDLARKEVPAELQADTSVYVKATAGLRLLGEETQMQILDSVFLTIESYAFRCKREWVSVIDGQEEAVGAWVTVNYLIDKLSTPSSTVGVLDLGGASTQLSCVPASSVGSRDNDKLVSVPIGSSSVKVYVVSWLRYGLVEFRKRIDEAVHLIGMRKGQTSGAAHHPCFPKQYEVKVEINGEEVHFHGTGDYDACSDAVSSLMKTLDYSPPPCSGRFLAISYYLDVLQSVGLGPVVGVADILAKATSLCGFTVSQLSPLVVGAKKGFDVRVCGDLIYIAALLSGPVGLRASASADARSSHIQPQHDTLAGDFTPDYIRLAKKISGKELSWTLGAMLAAIPSREPQSNKQAPLPPIADVVVESPTNIGVMQQLWFNVLSWWLDFPAEVRSVAATSAISCFLAVNIVALLMWISIRRSGLKQD